MICCSQYPTPRLQMALQSKKKSRFQVAGRQLLPRKYSWNKAIRTGEMRNVTCGIDFHVNTVVHAWAKVGESHTENLRRGTFLHRSRDRLIIHEPEHRCSREAGDITKVKDAFRPFTRLENHVDETCSQLGALQGLTAR